MRLLSVTECDFGRAFFATSKLASCGAALRGDIENDYCDDPSPRRAIPRRSFLTTTSLIATRGCHNRCGFCYLATDGLRMPYRMRHPQQMVEEFNADDQPYAVFVDNNLRLPA